MDQKRDIFRLRGLGGRKESHLMPAFSPRPMPRYALSRFNRKVARQDGTAVALGLSWDDVEKYDQALKTLVAELGNIREEERRKVADDLHDQVGQNLVLAKMKLGSLQASVPKQYTAAVQEVRELISEAISDTRSLVHDLYPQALREIGLKAVIDWLIEHMQSRYGLHCVAEIGSVPKSVGQDVQDVLFQAVRELLINVAKHARARQAKVSLQTENGLVTIQVVDDGSGFDPARGTLPKSKIAGFGLLSLRERLARLGGDLHIDSSPGKGARIEIRLPVKNDPENHK